MHKLGVALTIILGVIGIVQAGGLPDMGEFEPVLLPILGILVFGGFLKLMLSRA